LGRNAFKEDAEEEEEEEEEEEDKGFKDFVTTTAEVQTRSRS